MARPFLAVIVPFVAALVPFAVDGARPRQNQAVPVYEGEVQTALKAHCGTCHTGESASAGLDLTNLAGVIKGGSSGKAVIPGKSAESLLLMRLEGKGGMAQMPLGFKPLAPQKIKAIRDWIDAGCKSNGGPLQHWSYSTLNSPSVPRVRLSQWPRNPIDHFVLAKIEREGLSPAPEAPKTTLVRRLFLDLTGLPPTPSDVDAYLADQRPDAYERLVDRLLASPKFGERMARPWLDLARYADSDGYEKDLNRTAWKYRDWVIDAFNRNMPYDQFTIEQLAGDMLPKPTLEQLVATGFNRNAMFNSEGGVDPGEAQFNVVLDRVNTTSTVWLGSTLQCARCHDHKYDPFSQRDYYRLYAVFANTEVYKLGDYKKGQESWYEATIDVPTPEQAKRKEALERAIPALKHQLEKPGQQVTADFDRWLASGGEQNIWTLVGKAEATSSAGQTFAVQTDSSFLASGRAPANDAYTVTFAPPAQPITAIRLEVLPDPSFPNKGPGRASSGNFILSRVEVKAGTNNNPVHIAKVATSFTQAGYDPGLVLTGSPDNGWAIFNAYGQTSEMVLTLAEPLRTDRLQVVLRFDSKQWPEHVIGRFRFSATSSPAPSVLPNKLRLALADPAIAKAERGSLLIEFQRLAVKTRPNVERLERLQAELASLKASIPSAMVMREKPERNLVANVHVRGEYLQKGEEVLGGPPSIVSPRPAPEGTSRLEFARWLVSKDNPLTARVQVNRLWELLFGRGIVETSEDFGSQGTPPSHPELLDWLAVRYQDSGWDTKAMLKLMVSSATYRQSSDSTVLKNAKDPKNFWLSHAPRFRMEAEGVRDTLLKISGLLSEKRGGPSVYPSQPPGIWNTPYNSQQWADSMGDDKYRRGIYTFWKRSAPFPSFLAMDATSRETCTVRRIRTNTPSQALALLNDQTSIDSAKGLARQMAARPSSRTALIYGFRACTSRTPDAKELAVVETLFARSMERLKQDPTATAKLAQDARQAAYVMVANTLLNLDETISRN